VPIRHQPPLPAERFIVRDAPDDEAVPMDVVFVGAGPAGLAGAIELAKLVRRTTRAAAASATSRSPCSRRPAVSASTRCPAPSSTPARSATLFPELKDEDFPFRAPVRTSASTCCARAARRIPTPPTMKNHGNYIASLCEVVRWMGEKAEELGINVFTGFPAESLLVDGEPSSACAPRPTGLNRDGSEGSGYQPPTDITARVVALSEGTRGSLAQAFFDWQKITSENPQIYALGVKEIWETKKPLDAIIHTLGWPLPGDAFGGSFMYPLEPNVVALGLVVGLDYRNARLDVHALLQQMKLHPLFREYLEGGEMVEWGAKTIPEGGYYAIPSRRSGNGVVVLGDSAGYVEVASLKGVHYAVQSGILAARAIFDG
jgi:electron-transferring-flavoprotein dehydrogenase